MSLASAARAQLADTDLPALSVRLVSLIRTQLDRGQMDRITLSSVARTIGMSERSVQRQLAAEGNRFRKILDQAHALTALELSRTGAPDEMIARRLGYTSPSAFSRALVRWRHEARQHSTMVGGRPRGA
jgi:AraC-like DNA-binding protein